MIKLYHFNHGCHDCVPNTVFGLLPIPAGEFAADYKGWKRAFPDGVSLFGYRHMTRDVPFEQVSQEKVDLEIKCELMRRKFFGHIPSRFQSFFAFETINEAIEFCDSTTQESGIVGSIWEVEADRIHHRGDMELLMPGRSTEPDLFAYWNGKPQDGVKPTWECLVVPPVKMICRVETDDMQR